MAEIYAPWKASWKEVSEDLHSLRSLISLYQGRFRDAGHNDTAEDLERCIQLLNCAQVVAEGLSLSRPDARDNQSIFGTHPA
jgi:hypothetical protein